MFLASVLANTLLQFILAVSAFLITDLPGEKPARYAFRVAFVGYFLAMLTIFIRLHLFSDSADAQSIAFIMTSWGVGFFLAGIALGFGWRSGHSNILGLVIACLSCHLVASFYMAEDIESRTTLYVMSSLASMAYIFFCTLTRKPNPNIADRFVTVLTTLILTGLIYREFSLTGAAIEDFSTSRYVWIILSPTLMAGLSLFVLGSYMSDTVGALTRQAVRDPLTNLFNRRFLAERAEEMLSYADRRALPVSIILLDIDNFKSVNDSYGHEAGDTALIEVSRILLMESRNEDVVSRLGGEEFVVLMQNTTQQCAAVLAERLREVIENTKNHAGDKSFSYTASFGVFCNEEGEMDLEQMLSIADDALYQAKDKGRNQVICS